VSETLIRIRGFPQCSKKSQSTLELFTIFIEVREIREWEGFERHSVRSGDEGAGGFHAMSFVNSPFLKRSLKSKESINLRTKAMAKSKITKS
jgi:hypothetical protein